MRATLHTAPRASLLKWASRSRRVQSSRAPAVHGSLRINDPVPAGPPASLARMRLPRTEQQPRPDCLTGPETGRSCFGL